HSHRYHLLPTFDTKLTTLPEKSPYSASKELVKILNSWMESSVGTTAAPLKNTSWTYPPFSINALVFSLCPFTDNRPAERLPETGCPATVVLVGTTPACKPSRSR